MWHGRSPWQAGMLSAEGLWHLEGLQEALAPQRGAEHAARWQQRSHVSAELLFLAGSWDIMTASISESLFTAGEIARFGGKNTTTSSNFIPLHGNYSNRLQGSKPPKIAAATFVPYLEPAQTPPPLSQPMKPSAPS